MQRPEPLAALSPLVGGRCRGTQAVPLKADERIERRRRRAARQQRLGQRFCRLLAVADRVRCPSGTEFKQCHHTIIVPGLLRRD